MKTAPAPQLDSLEIDGRSPFGPADVQFVGARRNATGAECRDPKGVGALGTTGSLDAYTVAYASPTCLMLVDEQGICRTWKSGTNGPDRFKFQGFQKGFAALRRAVTDASGEVVPETRYLLVPERIPPSGFCK